jgi:dTDP-4-dehydrorhamnose 3,5-epimerase
VIRKALSIAGVYLLEPDRCQDERGFSAANLVLDEWPARARAAEWIQCSVSQNRLAGTVRGLHDQADPHGETKLVRCGRGAIWTCWSTSANRCPPVFNGWLWNSTRAMVSNC